MAIRTLGSQQAVGFLCFTNYDNSSEFGDATSVRSSKTVIEPKTRFTKSARPKTKAMYNVLHGRVARSNAELSECSSSTCLPMMVDSFDGYLMSAPFEEADLETANSLCTVFGNEYLLL